MVTAKNIPQAAYGVLQKDTFQLDYDEIAEQVRRLGYAILDSGYSAQHLKSLSDAFDMACQQYVNTWGDDRLRSINERYTLRALLTYGGPLFMELAMNDHLLAVLRRLISGKFILNQQNGVINPPRESYNQGAWHRDLPYQHFVSSTPLAINALFCIDHFTLDNGSTFVLPGSHKVSAFPSDKYRERNAVQVEAKAGQYILLDCMLFHSGGFNTTQTQRRAVNHVYTIPYFKQQIKLPGNIDENGLSGQARELLGFGYQEPLSVEQYLASRFKIQES